MDHLDTTDHHAIIHTAMKPVFSALLFAFFMISAVYLPAGQQQDSSVIVSVALSPRIRALLHDLPLDRLMEWEGRLFLHTKWKDRELLHNRRIPFRIENWTADEGRGFQAGAAGGINGIYHSYAELELEVLQLGETYPDLISISSIGESLEGRRLYALKISDNAALDEDEAEVLILGCHHAREWISLEIPLLLAKHLAANYATDPEIRRIVDHSEIWIVPCINPDGLEYSIHFYRYWRKNRRQNADGSFGVDLNRNYGAKWGLDDQGSSPYPSSDTYRGAAPFSEPETRAVRDLCARHRFKGLISYHSYSQVILHPWGYTEDPPMESELLAGLSESMSRLMQPVNGRTYNWRQAFRLYPTNGDTTDWALETHGIPAFTFELPPVDILGGGFFNAEEDIRGIFSENLPALLYFMDWAVHNKSEDSRKAEIPGVTSPVLP